MDASNIFAGGHVMLKQSALIALLDNHAAAKNDLALARAEIPQVPAKVARAASEMRAFEPKITKAISEYEDAVIATFPKGGETK